MPASETDRPLSNRSSSLMMLPSRRLCVRLLGALTIAALLGGVGCNFFKKATPTEADKEKDKKDNDANGAKTPEEFVSQLAAAEKSTAKAEFDKKLDTMLPFLAKEDREAMGDIRGFARAWM